MLFLDNPAPDSCCAERPLHIPTYPRLVSTAATVREKTCEQIHRQTDRPTDKPTDYNNPSLRMRARGLKIRHDVVHSKNKSLIIHTCKFHVCWCCGYLDTVVDYIGKYVQYDV